MIMDFVKAWEENKEQLENYFKTNIQSKYCGSYNNILAKVIDIVLNPYFKKIKAKALVFDNEPDDYGRYPAIDYGDYQGTIILTFHEDIYNPSISRTYYTSVYYGSCAGCDTLKRIHEYEEEKIPNDEQVKDYMTLALHLIQNIRRFDDNSNCEDLPIYIVTKKPKPEGYMEDLNYRYSNEVTLMKHKDSGKYSFINLTKCHICPCQFDSIEDAEKDLEKQITEGKILKYNKIQ